MLYALPSRQRSFQMAAGLVRVPWVALVGYMTSLDVDMFDNFVTGHVRHD